MPDETGCSSAATKIAAAALAAVVLVSRYDSAPAQPAATEASPKPPSAMGETAAFAPAAARDAARASAAAQNEQVIPGLELDVWAPPGLVANALTLDFDPQGRAYVVSSARAGLLLDIRQHREWIPEVHSLRSTEDLRAFFRRVMAPERSADNQWLPDFNEDGSRDYRDLTVVAERVFRVEDTDGDGIADRSTVVHEGFNDDIASDIAGGILVRGEHIYVTAAPDLWRLRDTTGDGLYDEAVSMSHGYSVHPAFSGHDMSAVEVGPDGRLYWKIGDIGMNVVDDTGKRWELPTTGAVLRSEFDGSGFEVFAWGLRNVQEIAFDKHGNLVSVDNDGDHAGETERVVYIVQGSDAGWRSTWQYGKYTDPQNNGYNVWMEESLFRPHFDGQAAYITPPIAPHRSGPSGFAFNPGTALSARWRDYFFVTSFTGGASNASVYAFRLEPDGAGFTFADDTQIARGLLSSGMAFGPDGAMYLTDWVQGWGATGQGQLWRLDVPEADRHPLRDEVQALIASGFGAKRASELETLLAHADMRVRLEAQLTLAARGEARRLRNVARGHDNELARLHGIWGLGQLARRDVAQAEPLHALLADPSTEVRAQAAKTLGDARDASATNALIAALGDDAARVRFFAAEALGRIGAKEAVEPIARMLAANAGRDVYLRTAGIHALAGIGDGAALAAFANHESQAVRIAAVVALRRLRDAGVAAFVTDADPLVVTEAARAINDEGGIAGALPALAAALTGPVRDEAFVRRAISANLRVGNAAAAARLASYAADTSANEETRIEAIAALRVWPAPSTLDRVDGAWLGQPGPRDTLAARTAAAGLLALLDAEATSPSIKVAVLEAAATLGVDAVPAFALRRLEQDAAAPVRVAALNALTSLGGATAERAVGVALADREVAVRTAALAALPRMPMAAAVKVARLAEVVDSSTTTVGEQQSALATLGALRAPEAVAALGARLDALAAGRTPSAVQLDLLQAAVATGDAGLLVKLEQSGAGRALENVAAVFPAALQHGGSAQRGRRLATNDPTAQCTRCHTLGNSQSDVGPTLNGIGARLTRAQLLESLVAPSATLARGFENDAGVSPMPPMGAVLTPAQIRDLVEFLASEGN